MEKSLFYITDEDKGDVCLSLLGKCVMDEKHYCLAKPEKAEENDFSVLVLRITGTADKPKFSIVKNDKVCQAVIDKITEKILK